jgi:serine/threonine protein phosphatase PrpC
MSAFSLKIAGLAHQGKKRSSQQDRVVTVATGGAVADGMGGQLGGAVAAQLGVDAFLNQYTAKPPTSGSEAKSLCAAVVNAANSEVYERGQTDPACTRMGSTLIALVTFEDRWYASCIGDSRLYELSAGKLQQRSIDHSVAAKWFREGTLTYQQAEQSPYWHVLYRYLGAFSAGQKTEDEGDAIEGVLQPGTRLLACSDGIDKELSDAQVEQIMLSSDDPEVVAQALIDAANAAGGSDNIAVLVVFALPV